MKRRSVLPVILSLGTLLCAGCGEPADSEGDPAESQVAAFEMLQAVDANVTLDSEGMIIAVGLEDETQGDEVFEYLKGISTIKRLELSGSAITDAGLVHLKEMSGLEYVTLEDTNISASAARALRQALPNCRIDHGEGEEE